VFGKFDRESPSGRAVQAGEETLDDPLRNDFETAQAGDLDRVEQIEPGCGPT
jgi:hypothetical protein